MNKGISLCHTQIKAIQDGASLLMFPVFEYMEFDKYGRKDIAECIINNHSPLKIGDKDIHVKEEFVDIEYYDPTLKRQIVFRNDSEVHMFEIEEKEWQPASQMTKEQSRYKIDEVIDIRVVRVQELEAMVKNETIDIRKLQGFNDFGTIRDFHNTQLEELSINRTYQDNDYVFLIETKEIK